MLCTLWDLKLLDPLFLENKIQHKIFQIYKPKKHLTDDLQTFKHKDLDT